MSYSIDKKLQYTEFSIANNQSAVANITGLSFSSSANKSFIIDYSVDRKHTNGNSAGSYEPQIAEMANVGSSFNLSVAISFMAQQSTGKILIIGGAVTYGGQNTTTSGIIRVNSDFSLDTTFTKPSGVANTGFTGGTPNCVQVDSNDKIYVTGAFTGYNGTTLPGSGGFARLNSDGTLDTAFMTNLGTGFNGTSTFVYIQSNGKIILSGNFTTFNGNTRTRIVRLNSDGTEDTTFATNIGAGVNVALFCIGVDSSGNIYGTGAATLTSASGNTVGKIARWDSTGTFDSTWNSNVGTTGPNASPTGFIIQPTDDKLVIFGNFTSYQGTGNPRFRLLRLNTNGTEDTTFTSNLNLSTTGFNATTNIVTYVPAISSLFVGGAFTNVNGSSFLRAVFLNLDGTFNTSVNTTIGTASGTQVMTTLVLSNGILLLGLNGSGTAWNGNPNNNGLIGLYTSTADINLAGVGRMVGVYHQSLSGWLLSNSLTAGNSCGISYFITSAGQIQYTSTNLAGTLAESRFRYVVTAL